MSFALGGRGFQCSICCRLPRAETLHGEGKGFGSPGICFLGGRGRSQRKKGSLGIPGDSPQGILLGVWMCLYN